MSDNLRTRIAKALYGQILHPVPPFDEQPDEVQAAWLEDADAVIAELPELRRIAQVREVCVASLNVDRVPGEALSDRGWLADTVLNVLNGAVDE